MTRVFISGLGSLSALGIGVPLFWSGLVEGRTGIGPISQALAMATRVRVAAELTGYAPGDHFPVADLPLLDRFSQFSLVAAREAVADAGLAEADLYAAALVLGTGCGGKETDEQTYHRLYAEGRPRVHPYTIPRGMPSAAASQVSIGLGIHGPAFSVTSACASAGHAIAQAVLLIRSGCVAVALAGGTDAPFTFGLLKAWEALRVLSPDGCRPFSRHRNGLVLGEGAGFVVLESESHAHRRGARIYGELAGFGMSSDAAHITDPSSHGPQAAMLAALRDAALTPDGVDYINAHGTATEANDPTETRSIRAVFGAHADHLLVSSTKGAHGHALGASGALELIATVLAVRNGIAPPTLGLAELGEGCDLDYVPNHAREQPIRAALSNSFAFGGLNAVLAVRRAD